MTLLPIRYLQTTVDIQVSEEDVEYVKSLTLRWDGRYVRHHTNYLHRLIAQRIGLNLSDKSMKIDHIDNDQKNNTRENLRMVSVSENARNGKITTRNQSGFKGVSKGKNGKFEARILENKKIVWRKTLPTPEEAHEAYCQESVKRYGDKWKAQ